jgi:hypothetical protein
MLPLFIKILKLMAINVDTVYRTVLLIMNKEQRGYLTPEEFNKIGGQVQLEIFNSYFEELNQQLRTIENDSEYANRVKTIEHKLEYFKETPKTLVLTTAGGPSSQFFSPPQSSTQIGNQTITTTTAQVYTLTIPPQDVKDGTLNIFLDGVKLTNAADYIISTDGTSIQLTTIPSVGQTLQINVFENNFYKLGTVIYNDEVEVEELTRPDFLRTTKSPLTAPTTAFPVYLYENNKIYIRPTTISSNVTASYVRKPVSPKWDFTVDVTTQAYVYNYNTSVNFELDMVEQTSLITRILLYAGIVIRDPQVVQIAANQIQQEQVNEKS